MKQPPPEGREQASGKLSKRAPFPWGRVLVVFLILLLLSGLAVVGLVGVMHSANTGAWTFIVPVLIGIVGVMVPIVQWLFPLNTSASGTQPDSASDGRVILGQTNLIQSSRVHPLADIFHFNETQLPDPGEFYAREYERLTLLTRTGKRNSTALVGDYRIGKSWMMQYLQQRAPSQLGSHVHVGKLSATHPQSQTPAGFVKRALEVLEIPVHKTGAHVAPLERLAIAARELKTLGIIPVLCIDEFAGIIGKPGFDKDFVMGLRAIAEDEGLVLVTASKQSLHEVIENMTGETSPLFNIMPEIALKPFSEAEAKIFISEKSQQAGFSKNEQAFFLECAAIDRPDGKKGWPPMRLQLVGQILLMEKRRAAEEKRAYAVNDLSYQEDFKRRLDEQYLAVVKKS